MKQYPVQKPEMSNETPNGAPPDSGRRAGEGLSAFGIGRPSKFDLQTANDLFQEYEKGKDPRTLGKINDLALGIMKRSAEEELAKLDPPRTRAEIEAEMTANLPAGTQGNDHLPYVIVSYLRNVEKLEAGRDAERAAARRETADKVAALRVEVAGAEAVPAPTAATPATVENPPPAVPGNRPASEKGGTAAPKETAAGPAATETPSDKTRKTAETDPKSAAILEKNRQFVNGKMQEIAQCLTGAKDGGRLLRLLANPTPENVSDFQKSLGMPATGPNRVDGRFGWRTLRSAKLFSEGKPIPMEDLLPPSSATARKTGERPDAKPTTGKDAPASKPADKKAAPKMTEEQARMESELFHEKLRRTQAEYDSLGLQKSAVRGLKPAGKDTFVAEWSFFAAGSGSSFRFEAAKGWQWLDTPNHSDPANAGRWRPVGGLAEYTRNGVTSVENFRFNKEGQAAVNAMLKSIAFASENGVPLEAPSAVRASLDNPT